MSSTALEIRCPACARAWGTWDALARRAAGRCACARAWEAATCLVLDANAPAPVPLPLEADELRGALRNRSDAASFKSTLEHLLLATERKRGERLQQLLREGRGAVEPLLAAPAPRGARALFLGNAFSGTLVALARAGWSLWVLDPSAQRLEFARQREAALAPPLAPREPSVFLCGGADARLPFPEDSFALVVQEDGIPGDGMPWGHGLDEVARVCAGELWLSADNRLAYKRSSGVRGDFRVMQPHQWLARACFAGGERSLLGYRRALARAGFCRAREYALYPHSRDFTHVVALDGSMPRLLLGPKERENRAKTAAQRAGLFPLFTPSFAFVAARHREQAHARPKVERLLGTLAERLGEPCPRAEHWVATRGNTIVLLCAAPEARGTPDRASWCVHLPLSPAQERQTRRHHERLFEIRRDFPAVPVPEPLFLGELEGCLLAVERRVPGLSTPQLAGSAEASRALYASLGPVLAQLARPTRVELDEARFAELVAAKFARVLQHAPDSAARVRLERLLDFARQELLGASVPLVLYHGDLRGKHVQVAPPERGASGGELRALLDWGSSESADLPYFDLLHLVVHERKQAQASTPAAAWRDVRERRALSTHEREFLDDYAARLRLSAGYCRALEHIYPVLVAAMAEANWDYSRPAWLQRNFEV